MAGSFYTIAEAQVAMFRNPPADAAQNCYCRDHHPALPGDLSAECAGRTREQTGQASPEDVGGGEAAK